MCRASPTRLDARLEVAGLGTLTVDTAYGGDSFVIADAAALGFALVADEARDLAELGMRITAAANEQLGFAHPENPDWDHISFCLFAGPVERGARACRQVASRGDPARQDRPLADRHGAFGAHGGAARAGPDAESARR